MENEFFFLNENRELRKPNKVIVKCLFVWYCGVLSSIVLLCEMEKRKIKTIKKIMLAEWAENTQYTMGRRMTTSFHTFSSFFLEKSCGKRKVLKFFNYCGA